MKDELDKELQEYLKNIQWSLDVFGKITVSLEKSFENIVMMIIEKTRSEIEDSEELTDEDIKREMREEFEELKRYLQKNKVVVKKLGDLLYVDVESDSVKITNTDNLETLLRQSNLLIQDLISELVNELDVLVDEYKSIKENGTAAQVASLISLLEELVDRSFEANAILETHFDWDLETDIEFEEVKRMFQEEEEKPRHLTSIRRLEELENEKKRNRGEDRDR